MEEPLEGTLADLWQLMGKPPRLRQGHVELIPLPSPAAGANLVYPIGDTWWERITSLAFTFTASATAAGRTLGVALCDQAGVPFNVTAVASGLQAGQAATFYGDLSGVSAVDTLSSFSGEGSVTSGAAGATIATTPTLPAGQYLVTANVALSGTLTAGTDNNNTRVVAGGQTWNLDNTIQPGLQPFGPFDADLTSPGAVVVQIGTNTPTVASVYSAFLSVTPAGAQAGYELPDIVMKSGWQVQIQVGNAQAGDQLSGVYLMTERYASNYADGTLRSDEERLARWLARAITEGSL